MTDPLQAKIRVVSSDENGQIADIAPTQFRQPDVDQIATITNQFVQQLQEKLQTASTTSQEKSPGTLTLSEIELTFGIDFEAEVGTDVKIPLIGPVIRGGIKGGATFEVHITLSRDTA